MSYLIDLLKAQEDTINGGTLFDHTSILFGCGMATGPHSTRNLPLLLAGGGFKLGEHMVCPPSESLQLIFYSPFFKTTAWNLIALVPVQVR